MRKAQLSFEFVVLFAFLLLLFILLGQAFPMTIEGTASTKGIADNIAKDIKVRVITASLSQTDYEGDIMPPSRINNVKINISIVGEPDNILLIKGMNDNQLIARAFLPTVDSIIDSGGANPVSKISVNKTISNDEIIIKIV